MGFQEIPEPHPQFQGECIGTEFNASLGLHVTFWTHGLVDHPYTKTRIWVIAGFVEEAVAVDCQKAIARVLDENNEKAVSAALNWWEAKADAIHEVGRVFDFPPDKKKLIPFSTDEMKKIHEALLKHAS